MTNDELTVGVYIDAHVGIDRSATRIEQAGFSHLWVYDSPLVFGEPWMAMALAARTTTEIVIGPGVTHPRSRPVYATAQALGTLGQLAGGRTSFGLGIGNSARWSLGMDPVRQDELFAYARDTMGLLAGDTVPYREGDREHGIAFIHPEGRWLDLTHRPELWISAFGPRGQRRAAEVADGILVRWEGPEAMAEVRARVDRAATEAGRDPRDVRLGVVYAVYPYEREAELDGDEARDALGPLVISRLRFLTANHQHADEVPEPFRPGFDAYLRHRAGLDDHRRHLDNYLGYLTFVPDHLQEFVHPESMRTVCLAADAAGVAAELRRMRDAGVDHVSLQVAGPPDVWIERMGRDVLPAV
ncbi:MAG: LLM class flavin-dependent oxidoreductase [Patulibacter sp.]|nr:LLM class flavin-dependent oxidoreductase [Patulibacter sp.]